MTEKVPNLFIVGAAKCGTTSLYNYLSEHPSIYGPQKKEPRYLTKDYITALGITKKKRSKFVFSKEEYLSLYEGATTEKYIIDGSVFIMFFEQAIIELKKLSPEYKVIVALRDPVKRFISHYKMAYNAGDIKLPLQEFLHNAKSGIGINTLEMGEYTRQIKNLYKHLDEDRIKIVFFEEFKKDNVKTIEEICDFLEIEGNFSYHPEKVYHKGFGITKSKTIGQFYIKNKWVLAIKRKLLNTKIGNLKFLINKWLYKPLIVEPASYDFLYDYYKQDVLDLEKLLNKDLSHWKK